MVLPHRISKSADKKLAKKSTVSKKATTTVRGGNDLFGRINEIKANVERNLGHLKNKYKIIENHYDLIEYLDACIENKYISIDTETTGLDPIQDRLVGICIYTYGEKGAYIPLNHISYVTGIKAQGQLEMDFVVSEFNRLLEFKPDIDMFNAKFDIRVLRNNGIKDIYCTWDGFLASQLLNENEESHSLKQLHKKYVLKDKKDAFGFESLFKGITFDKIPINVGYLYAANDPVITTELCDYQRKHLRLDSERQDLRDLAWVFHNIEMPCVDVVSRMEDVGIKFDFDFNEKLKDKYHRLLEERVEKFHKVCEKYSDKIEKYRKKTGQDCKLDNPINIKSPVQLAILLYDIVGCEMQIDKKTKKPMRSTGEKILKSLDNDVANAILDYREFSTIVDTFIDKLPDCVFPDGRIHCTFNQYGARTGRFSSENPNMQNIPSHNKEIRKMFVATDGYVIMSSDYSQQEPKVMTQMCQDPKMLDAYNKDKDLYAEIASLSFNKSYEDCLEFYLDENGNKTEKVNKEGKERRSQAKSILLGVLYGRGVPSIAEQLGTTTEKAQAVKDSVFKGFPAIPKFEQDSLDMAYELGYVTTLWGRKRRLPDLQLPEYEFRWKDGAPPDDDLLDFEFMNEPEYDTSEVPEDAQDYYLRKLRNCWGKEKRKIFEEANEEGIWIVDNGAKIADAQRQCVNARIQGSAADMSKLAMIKVGNDERLKELGFRLLIPVHDELIAECPEENAEECRDRFAKLMSEAAEDKLTIPIKCDVEVTKRWYGESVL